MMHLLQQHSQKPTHSRTQLLICFMHLGKCTEYLHLWRTIRVLSWKRNGTMFWTNGAMHGYESYRAFQISKCCHMYYQMLDYPVRIYWTLKHHRIPPVRLSRRSHQSRPRCRMLYLMIINEQHIHTFLLLKNTIGPEYSYLKYDVIWHQSCLA